MKGVSDIQLYNPMNYICGKGVLFSIGKYAETLGHKAFMIGTPESFRAAGETIRESLYSENILFQECLFSGYPTEKQALSYASEIKEYGADFLIAAGGGRVIDTAKYAASLAGKAIITVPTVSAANASYRRDSIIYTDLGQYQKKAYNQRSPAYVIADSNILAQQPIRYLKAGVIDTMVRWYESNPYVKWYGGDLHFQFSSGMARLLYEFFNQERDSVLKAFESGTASSLISETVTRIIGLAGLSSNYQSKISLQGFAHPFYNQVTRIRSSAKLLHGEVIGYGILVQLILEGKDPDVIQEEWDRLYGYGFNYSLEDLGIFSGSQLDQLAEHLYHENLPSVLFLDHVQHASEIKEAILRVHDGVLQRRKEGNLIE